MLTRIFRLAALAVGLAALGSPAQAAPAKDKPDAKSAGPAVVVRVQAINDLLKTVEYVQTLLPEDAAESLKQGVGFVKDLIDEKKGLVGIDVKQPIGLYVTLTEDVDGTPPVVGLIPVADEKALLDFLENGLPNLKLEKQDDGSYKTKPDQVPEPIFFRFANGYAYVTIGSSSNIDPKALPKPADVLGAGKPEHLISASVRLDRLPEGMRKMALAAVEAQIGQAKDQPLPVDSKATKALRDKAIDELVTNLKNLLEGGQEAALRLNVDPKAEEVSVEIELSGKQGSQLAKDIKSIRENKSVAGGAVAFPDAALSLNLSVAVPAGLKPLLPAAVDDLLAEFKKQAPGEIQTKAEPLIKAVLPTVKAGELDLGFALVGPDKGDKYTAVAALKVVDGKKIESAVRDIVKKELPPEIGGLFDLDAPKMDGNGVIRVKLADMIQEKEEKVIGKSDLYVVFRDDLVLAAIGPQSQDLLKKALAGKPADVGVLRASVSLARVVPVIGENAQELATARKVAEKVFGKGASKADEIRFSVEGGDSLKIKLMAKGKAIQFLAELGTAKKDN